MGFTDRETLAFVADVVATGGMTDANVDRVARFCGTSVKATVQTLHALGWLGGGSGSGSGGMSTAAVTALVKAIVATDPACVGPQGPAGPQGPPGSGNTMITVKDLSAVPGTLSPGDGVLLEI